MGLKVELIDSMGSDLSVVNAARVSFDKESGWTEEQGIRADGRLGTIALALSDRDTKLIQFLARGLTTEQWNEFLDDVYSAGILEPKELEELLWSWRRTPEHFAPFAHPHVTFRIKAPIFVARQLAKHQVGMVWSEVSRRYVSGEPEFFIPHQWRAAPTGSIKQGSGDGYVLSYPVYVDKERFTSTPAIEYAEYLDKACTIYQEMIDGGVCPEQARMVLPQSMMTEWIWTGSLYGWANVFNKRKQGSHAQRECWPIATAIGEHMLRLFPVSWAALTN